MCSLIQESGGKEDKERRESRKARSLLDPPDAPVYDKAAFLSSSATDSLALPPGTSIMEPLVTTDHSCSLPCGPRPSPPIFPRLPPKKNGLSFLWLNSIPSTLYMHRQGLVRMSASFITLQLLLLLCVAVFACVHGSSPDLS